MGEQIATTTNRAWASHSQFTNQNDLHTTSGFEMCFAIDTLGGGSRVSRRCQPKHVSNPGCVIEHL